MYLLVIGWLYVAFMMAIAEAFHANGSVLGAIVTFVFYGLLPTALAVYLMGTPSRRRAVKAREAEEALAAAAALAATAGSSQPDTGSHPATAAEPGGVASMGKKPE
jgi:hypothetical protein